MAYYSAINVPTDVEGLVQIISSNINYYISPDGNDSSGVGTSVSPWKTLTKAFDFIKNKRIAKDASVTFTIKRKENMDFWYEYLIDDTNIVVEHPDADRIIIQGEISSTLNLYGVNYYDSTLRAMGDSITGGYLMEITVQDATNVSVGDFITIKDSNYSAGSSYTTGMSGATFIETDFDHYETSPYSGEDISGSSADYAPLSLRKCLAFGCHEVIGVDVVGGSISSDTVLLHIRHTNNTFESYANGTDGATAYVTPQSLQFSSDVNNFPSTQTTAGYIQGNVWSDGATGHRLGVTGTNKLPVSGGYTAGASGSYGGWTAEANGGTDIGGISGGNGYWWDKSPQQSNGMQSAFSGIEVKHLPCRINFQNSSGLEFNSSQLGKLKDLVICGPSFALGATASILTDGSVGVKANDGGGLIETDNIAVVGFESGFVSENNSQIIASGSISSACKYGFVSNNNSQMEAKHTIASGCYDGYSSTNHSNMNSSYSISVANENDGMLVSHNSNMDASFGLSCMNTGYGYHINNSSNLHLSPDRNILGENGVGTTADSLNGGATSDVRYHYSDKTGSFAFRNNLSGVYVENSNVYATNTRSSYNLNAGVLADRKSHIDANHINTFNNGLSAGNNYHGSGFVVNNQSTGIVGMSTSENNKVYGFHSDYGSNLIATGASGGTADGGQGAGTYGLYSDKDSLIFNNNASGSTASANNGAIRDY